MERDNKNNDEESHERRFGGEVDSAIHRLDLIFRAKFLNPGEDEFPWKKALFAACFFSSALRMVSHSNLHATI